MDAKKIANILAVILVLVYLAWSFTNEPTQVVTNSKVDTQETKSLVKERNQKGVERTQEEMGRAISSSAENNGWDITKFKSNTLIAEKVENENSISVTVIFDNSSFSLSPENKELYTILSDSLR